MKDSRQRGLIEWRKQVISHHKQSIAAQNNYDSKQDFWRGETDRFRDDPFRINDSVLNKLVTEFNDCDTVLDVGGGAGRFALPLARSRSKITVVDSSESMLEQLRADSTYFDITNVDSLLSRWEDTDIGPHSGVLCSHVTYGIEDIVRFVNNLTTHADKRVLILTFMDSPQSHLGHIWEIIHEEQRIHLPGAPELMNVLWDLGLTPELEVIETLSPHIYQNLELTISDLRRRLYISEGGEKDHRFISNINNQLEKVADGIGLKYSSERTLCLIKWETAPTNPRRITN